MDRCLKPPPKSLQAKGGPSGLLLKPGQMLPFASLALGSALALFMYPHSVTGVLSSSSARTIRWNAILLACLHRAFGTDRASGLHGDRRQCESGKLRTRWFLRFFSKFSRSGSSDSASRPSRSVPWCPQRSCLSERPNCLLEIFGNRFSGRKSARRKRQLWPKLLRSSSNWAP